MSDASEAAVLPQTLLSGSEFAGVLTGQMLKFERQVFAAPALDGTGLQVLPLGNKLKLITSDAPLPDLASLAAFARSQGLDESAVQALFGSQVAQERPMVISTAAKLKLNSNLEPSPVDALLGAGAGAVPATITAFPGTITASPGAASSPGISAVSSTHAVVIPDPIRDPAPHAGSTAKLPNPATGSVHLGDKIGSPIPSTAPVAIPGIPTATSSTSTPSASAASASLSVVIPDPIRDPVPHAGSTAKLPNPATESMHLGDKIGSPVLRTAIATSPSTAAASANTPGASAASASLSVVIPDPIRGPVPHSGSTATLFAQETGFVHFGDKLGSPAPRIAIAATPNATSATLSATSASPSATAATLSATSATLSATSATLSATSASPTPTVVIPDSIRDPARWGGSLAALVPSGLGISPGSDSLPPMAPPAGPNSEALQRVGRPDTLSWLSLKAGMALEPSPALNNDPASLEAAMQDAARFTMTPSSQAVTRRLAHLVTAGEQSTAGSWPAQTGLTRTAPSAAPAWESLQLQLGDELAQALEERLSDQPATTSSEPLLAPARGEAASTPVSAPVKTPSSDGPGPLTLMEQRILQQQQLSDKLAQALTQRLVNQIERGQWKVQMRLQPEKLGQIEVELKLHAGGLDAMFRADNPLTRELIVQGTAKLRDALAQTGMAVATVWVNGDQSRQSGGNSTPGQGFHAQPSMATPQPGAEDPVMASVRNEDLTTQGLNIWA